MTDADLYSFRQGSWFGVFGDNLIVLLPPSEKARVAGLWELVDGGASFDEALDTLIASGLRDLPGFVLVARTDEGQSKVVLRGAGAARFGTGDGEIVVDGTAASTWVEKTIEGVTSAVIEVEASADDREFTVAGGLVRVAQVRTGAIAGSAESSSDAGGVSGGVVVSPGSEPTTDAAPVAEETPTPEPASEPVPETADTTGPTPDESADAPAEAAVEAAPEPDAPESAAPEPEPAAHDQAEPEPAAPEQAGPTSATPPEWAPNAADAAAPDAAAPDAADAESSTPAAPDQAVGWGAPSAQAAEAPSAPSFAEPAPGLPPVWAPAGSAGPSPTPPITAASVPGSPGSSADSSSHSDSVEHDGLTSAPSSGASGSDGMSSPVGHVVAKLVFSSGETIEVDRAIIIGRAPEARRFTSSEQPRLVTVPSPHQEISSTHLEIRPGAGADHGSAVVTDMGSTNGTVLVQPGLAPEDLRAGIAVQLVPGAIIDLGDGVTIQVTQP